jgi:hypothetical protein
MTDRKPPRLANWLLTRSGFAHQNPPLAGDLLEEFRSGRSAAWFWRQTLVAILTGLALNARLAGRPLIGFLIGWVAEVCVTFALWRFHLPRQLPHIFGTIAHAAADLGSLWLLWKVFRRRQPVARTAEVEGEPAAGLVESACQYFLIFVIAYCVWALFWTLPLWAFITIQIGWLLGSVKRYLAPKSGLGGVKMP